MENTNYYEHSKKEATKKKFEEKNEKKMEIICGLKK